MGWTLERRRLGRPPCMRGFARGTCLLKTAYILTPRDDWIWFVSLPFFAVLIGVASQQWLSTIAVASFALWVTAPHHFATWLRCFGVADDRRRHRVALVVGPVLLIPLIAAGLVWAPVTLLLVMFTWDHQHSIMQQYGLGRIYDHKARSSSVTGARLDLALHWVLYVNLLVVSPLYADLWVRELFRFGVPMSETTIASVQQISWLVTASFMAGYVAHALTDLRRGAVLNPIKFLFLGASYFLWYSTAWWMESIVVAKIAHSIMHGVQYIVIVHSHLRRQDGPRDTFVNWVVRPGNVVAFLVTCALYAFAYQAITLQPLSTFGFGLFDPGLDWSLIRPSGDALQASEGTYALYAALVIHSVALVHYYFDSFIWRVSDARVQRSL